MIERIRAAQPEDAHAIAVVHVEGWLGAYRGLMHDEVLDALDVEERAATRRRWLEAPGSPEMRCWVLERDDRIVGFVNTGPTREEDLDATSHELFAIYVLPEVIGTGAGRVLMQHTLADLAARGYAEVVLWVLVENDATLGFYDAAGFTPDVRVEPKEQPGARCLKRRLRRAL
ncbi:MAG: GNAT family N-acetyltransferase [Planctomycetota bacterium]|nr:GNAT family N-acetyltransferase [Planctomycetota bacterium]